MQCKYLSYCLDTYEGQLEVHTARATRASPKTCRRQNISSALGKLDRAEKHRHRVVRAIMVTPETRAWSRSVPGRSTARHEQVKPSGLRVRDHDDSAPETPRHHSPLGRWMIQLRPSRSRSGPHCGCCSAPRGLVP